MAADKDYCVCKIGKIKSRVQMRSYFEHHMRLRPVLNADEAKRSDNEILIGNDTLKDIFSLSMQEAERKERKKEYKSFLDEAEEAISEVEHDLNRKVRKDAVKEIEVVLTFSHGADVSLKDWKKANCDWLESYFGKDNVKSAVLHMDEMTPHIHAIVVPVDRSTGKAHLNSRKWIGGPAALIKMQNDYAKAMEPFGLCRGEKYSRSSNINLHEFYENINKIVVAPVPERKDFQTDEAYHAQIEKVYKSARMQIFALETQLKRFREVNQTLEWNQNKLLQSVEQTLTQAKEKEIAYQKELEESEREINEQKSSVTKVLQKAKTTENIQTALNTLQDTDPQRADEIRDILNFLIQTGEDINKKKEKEKEYDEVALVD